MENQENKIEQNQSLLFEARALIKTSALASDSCIVEKELQLCRQEEVFVVLKKVNAILADIEERHYVILKEFQRIELG